MSRILPALLSTSSLSLLLLSAPSYAAPSLATASKAAAEAADQPAEEGTSIEDSSGEGAGDILVLARRQEERLQDVPQTINVVTSETLDKLNTFSFTDISKLVSGLVLQPGLGAATIRGVAFNPVSQTTPNVAFYVNEGPVQGSALFSSLYDVGQVEVLKGPQGTFRGVSAPGGAITYYTRRADLEEFGGNLAATVSDLSARRISGALNIPLIPGKVGLRLAGLTDRTDGSPKSVNSGAEPINETTSFRASLRAEPTDNLKVNLTYQHLQGKVVSFTSVVGTGATGGAAAFNPNYTGRYVQPVGLNGPNIPIGSYLAVGDAPGRSATRQRFASANVDYSLLGQKLSYVGMYSFIKTDTILGVSDSGNLLAGDYTGSGNTSTASRKTHEIRLASEDRILGIFDYAVGYFNLREHLSTIQPPERNVSNSQTVNAGAFGSPLGPPIAATPNYRFFNFTRFARSPTMGEDSFFAHLTAHIGNRTEIEGGVRIVDFKQNSRRDNFRSDGFRAVAYVNSAGQPINPQDASGNPVIPVGGRSLITAAQCAALNGQYQATYASVCDVPVLGGPLPASSPNPLSGAKPTLFSASAKHEFSDNLMIYANYGTSFRPGPPVQNIFTTLSDPYLDNIKLFPIEKAKSIEAGVKAKLFDRLRIDVAIYQQKYNNIAASPSSGLERTATTPTQALDDQTLNLRSYFVPLKAKTKGIDIGVGADITRNWSVNGGFSYAKATFSSSDVPCFDPDFDGVADSTSPTVQGPKGITAIITQGTQQNIDFKKAMVAKGIVFQTCKSTGGGFLDNSEPGWNANARTDWHHEIVDGIEGFFNGNMTYRPKNGRNPAFTQKAYALVDINFGVRNQEVGWELTAFVKNVFNNRTILSLGGDVASGLPGGSSALFSPQGSTTASGYRSISYAPRRELGLTARYSFGSR